MTPVVTKSPRATKRPEPSVPSSSSSTSLDRFFEITRRGSTVGQEVRGGLVTFFAMAYIIALNPLIIGTATDSGGLLISGAPKFLDEAMTQVDTAAVGASIGMVAAGTALIAGVMTILMGVIGRFPMGLATGLGLNALVAYVLAPQMTWPQAMGLVVWEGIIIALLVMTGFRTAVFKAVPRTLRTAISVGIGLFIAFVGLINAGVIRKPAGAPPVELGVGGSLAGWPILIFVIGLFLLIALHVRKVKGAMLISIVVATVLAIVVEAIGKIGPNVGPDNPTGWALNVPQLGSFGLPDLSLFGRIDMVGAFFPEGSFSLVRFITLAVLVFSLLLADFFDTMGTVVAVGSEANLLDSHGMPPRTTAILMVDSLGAVAGGLGSVSSNTCYVESTAGVGEGARTGLASVVTGVAFLVAILLSPIINMVPSEAASPVLVFVGFLMISQVTDIDWTDASLGIPAFLTMVLMPFSYSITTGIGVGFLAFVFIRAVSGRFREVHSLMWVVAAMFVLYFFQGPLLSLLA
ncbi:MAG: NCS2 family permease [Arachnia sp.]